MADKDTRCWGYKVGAEPKIFPDEEARAAAGFSDSPVTAAEEAQTAPEPEPKKKGPHHPKKPEAGE